MCSPLHWYRPTDSDRRREEEEEEEEEFTTSGNWSGKHNSLSSGVHLIINQFAVAGTCSA